jgi:Thermolysin metallopeptidase, catalytic domain
MRNVSLALVAAAGLMVGLSHGSSWASPAGVAGPANGGIGSPSRVLDVQKAYPGAQALVAGGNVVSIYGVAMTGGATPAEAAANFLAEHGDEFGEPGLDLRPVRVDVISNGSTVIAYQQHIDGLPVEFGIGRVLVNGESNRVTYAAARLAHRPEGGFAVPKMHATDALAMMRAGPLYRHLEEWSEPSLVIYDGDTVSSGNQSATIAWKFTGEIKDLARREVFTFFVDTVSGRLLEARNGVLHTDILGNVQAKGTPGLKPDSASNPPVLMPVELIRVKGPSVTAETDGLGNYVLANPGTTAVNVTTSLADGRWVRVVDASGTSVLSLTQGVTPPGPGNFVLNNSPTAFATAQVNAFVGTIKIHEYFKLRAPTFTAIEIQIPANVNIDSACNAFFDGSSINFYRAAGGCANTAYSDIVAHEYGHFVVQSLGLAQGSFGEGYSDSCGVLLYDTGIIGQDFCGPGCNVRNIDAANKQYPCAGGVHDCGQVLAGIWRDMRLKMTDRYGSELALELTRQLHVDWSLITVGGNDSNAAWPQTGIEAMIADDNDGSLLNGTPNYPELFYAFDKHNIDLPLIKPVNFVYPGGLPSLATANAPVTIDVEVVDGSETSVPTSASLFYRFSSADPFRAASLSNVSGGLFRGSIPGVICGKTVEFKTFIATQENPAGYFDPPSGANSYVTLSSGPAALADDFEGTSQFVSTGSALFGKWARVDPTGFVDDVTGVEARPNDDTTLNGTKAWSTGNGTTDIKGGETILTSPTFDLTGVANPTLTYQRWFYNNAPADTGNYLIVEISNNNGTSWTLVEKAPANSLGGWVYKEFTPTQFVSASATMKVRFRAADKSPDNVVVALVDDFRVYDAQCSCPADFDGTGFVDTEDFDAFTRAFENGEQSADFDQSGFVDTDDFGAYVLAFEIGC